MPPLWAPLIQLPIPQRWRALCSNLDWLLLRKFTISGYRLIHSDTGCQTRKENSESPASKLPQFCTAGLQTLRWRGADSNPRSPGIGDNR